MVQAIKEQAKVIGFSRIGIARAEELTEEKQRLKSWLAKGYHGEMKYMENHFQKRTDPGKLVPGARSVIVLAYNYHNPRKQQGDKIPKIAQYAYGKDYHFVVKDKLHELFNYINEEIAPISGRVFTDSAPVMERDWARRAGLGWIGKNTLLISPGEGSYFFLGELIIDLELVYDQEIGDYCGRCTRCIEACPTDAIYEEGYEMNGSKCISYATIELKGDIPEFFRGKMENWVFGCDICQDVCPWNRFATPHNETDFEPHPDLLEMSREDWEALDEDTFRELFRKSAVKRTKYEGLKRNMEFLKE